MGESTKFPEVAIGYIRGQMVDGRFMESLMAAVIDDLGFRNAIKGRVQPVFCSHYLNLGRNDLAKLLCQKYAQECDVFVMLDTDHAFTPEQLMHLISLVDDGHPIVSGRYYACDNLGEQIRPVMLRRREDGTAATMWEAAGNELVEVDVIGLGFCAMRVSVLTQLREQLGDTCFDFDRAEAGSFMPEDDAFCRRVQECLGLPIFVHTGIVPGHIKPFELTAAHERRKSI